MIERSKDYDAFDHLRPFSNLVGSYKYGKATGEWKIYHENGKIYQVRLWEKGKFMDLISCFDNKGNLLDKGTLINGNGTVKFYNGNGKLIRTETYNNGEKQE